MAHPIKRILLVTRSVQFAIDFKLSLESLGEYSVTAVTEARNAIERLRSKPHHLVLLDIDDLAIAPAVMIGVIRARQGDIAILLAPESPAAHELAGEFAAQGVVDIPAATRSLIPALEAALQEVYASLPETLRLPAVDMRDDTVQIEALVDDRLADESPPPFTSRRLQTWQRQTQVSGLDAGRVVELVIEGADGEGDSLRYHRVVAGDQQQDSPPGERSQADDDTPLTGDGEGSTVRHLAQSAGQASRAPRPLASPASIADASDDGGLGRALRAALDESADQDSLSLLTLYDPIIDSSSRAPEQKPAWLEESEKFVREPDFLSEGLPPMPADAATTTPLPAPAPAELRLLSSFRGDASINQLALTMTRMMTDLAAEATVLTRGPALVAFSGELPLDEFQALREGIGDDWAAQADRARLRFLTVPARQRHYMLYSRGSVDGLSLSLIFTGDLSMGAIRQQGDRMLRALEAVADNEPDGDDEAERGSGTDSDSRKMSACTFVWLVADTSIRLSESLARQLVFWLELQLNGEHWSISRLDVYEDCICLAADVPAGQAPERLIRDLMARSLRIARSHDDSLPEAMWADAYLVKPGSADLDARELRDFLQFAKA